MSGTKDLDLSADLQNNGQTDRSGIGQCVAVQETESEEKELTPAQKMDALLRGNSTGQLKREIEKLRKEAAKYRNSSKSETAQRIEIQAKAREIQNELETLKEEHRLLTLMRKLDKAGCIKSDLVVKDIPAECEDFDSFIEEYKEKNTFLFKKHKDSFGGTFKSSGVKNLTPSQQMDAYIRAALGR